VLTPPSRVKGSLGKESFSATKGNSGRLLQLRVLHLGFLQDGDVGVSVLPEREEILVAGGVLGLSGT
jgi:hypothetical protein